MRLDLPAPAAEGKPDEPMFFRPRNVALLDRFLRIAIGAELLAAVFVLSGELRWLGLAGALPLLSGIAGWCPIYAWLARD
jgi:hypothetical protein